MDWNWDELGVEDAEYQSFFELNKLLVNNHNSAIIFNSTTNQPHLNYYDLDVPKGNLESIERELKNIADGMKTFSLSLEGINFFTHGGIYIKCKLNEDLKELEKQIVEKVSILKGSCSCEDYWQETKGYWQQTRKYSELQYANREKYGNPYVMDAFVPHITIGSVKADEEMLKHIEVVSKLH